GGSAAIAESGLECAAGVELAEEDFEGARGGVGRGGKLKAAAGAGEVVDIDAGGRAGEGCGGVAVAPGISAGAVGELGLDWCGAERGDVGDLCAAGGFVIERVGVGQSPVGPVGGAFGGEVDGCGDAGDGAGDISGMGDVADDEDGGGGEDSFGEGAHFSAPLNCEASCV